MKTRKKQTNILILGAGFGGICTAKYLLKFTRKISNLKISLIDRNTYHFFTPLLHMVSKKMIIANYSYHMDITKPSVCFRFKP